MQIPRLYPSPTESETWQIRPGKLCSNKPAGSLMHTEVWIISFFKWNQAPGALSWRRSFNALRLQNMASGEVTCSLQVWGFGCSFEKSLKYILDRSMGYESEKWSESRSVVSDSLRPHGLYSPWNSPGQNTGVGSLPLLQGIFPSQGSNPGLLHCRWILYQLSHKRSPRILEWVAFPFTSGSSRPRNLTGVSCIAGRFFTNWAMREAPAWGIHRPKERSQASVGGGLHMSTSLSLQGSPLRSLPPTPLPLSLERNQELLPEL